MRTHFTTQMIIAASVFLFTSATQAGPAPRLNPLRQQGAVVVQLSSAVDTNAYENPAKNLWAVGLFDAVARFRFEGVPGFRIISDADQFPADKYNKANEYVFNHRFAIDYHAKSIFYHCALIRCTPQAPLAWSINRVIAFDNIGPGIDSCYLFLIKKIAGSPDAAALSRFFSVPSVGSNFKADKKLGDILFCEASAGETGTSKNRGFYQKLLEKEQPQLFVAHLCGKAALADAGLSENSDAVGLLKQVELSAASAVALYAALGDRFTAARRYEPAIALYRQALEINKSDVDLLLKISTGQLLLHREAQAAETYLSMYGTDRTAYLEYALRAARLFNRCGISDKAKNAYAEYLDRHNPADPAVQLELARLYFTDKNFTGVVSLLKEQAGKASATSEILRMTAESYVALERCTDAIRCLTVLMRLEPKNPRCVELAAKAYEKLGNLTAAADLYSRFLALAGPDHNGETAFLTGQLFEKIGRPADAVTRYEANVKWYPDDLRNYERLGALYASVKEWDKAQRTLETAMEFPQPTPTIKITLARVYVARNQKNHAVRLYQKYCNAVPGDAAVWREFGALLFDLKLYERAAAAFTEAAKGCSKDADCCAMLGSSYFNLNKLTDAVEALDRAHDLNPSDVATVERLAQCYRSLKRDDLLIRTLREWAQLEPRRADIRLELGALYIDKNKAGDATTVLADASRLQPLDGRAHTLLAKAYGMLKNDDLQHYHLKTACQNSSGDADPYYALARFYLSRTRYAEAESALQKTVALAPNSGGANFDLGTLLLDRGDTASFLTLGKAVAAAPNSPLYAAQYARAAALIGDRSAALAALGSALTVKSDDPRCRLYAGLASMTLGDPDAAKKLLDEALTLDKNMAEAYAGLGDICLCKAQFKQAAANYFIAWEKGGYRERVAMRLGTALSIIGKAAEAKDFYETVVLKNPANDEARYDLVAAQCLLGKAAVARETAKGFTRDGLLWSQLAAGRIHEADGNGDAAAISYAIVLRIAPRNGPAHLGLARVNESRGHFDTAITHYAIARERDSLDVNITMSMAAAYEKSGRTDSALYRYEEVIRQYPDHPDAAWCAGRLLADRRDHPAAIAVLRKGIGVHPGDARLYGLLGKQLAIAEDYTGAVAAFQSAFKNNPADIDALLQIGNIYNQKLMNDKKAKKFYAQYVKAGGKDQMAAEMAGD
jgi:tetratricopeptide (TPR) repeat protein